MSYKTRLPKSLLLQFKNRVRRECEKAAISGTPIGYADLAEAVIGDADRRSPDCRFIRLVTKALCENMRDDVEAGRPLSAVAVHSVGSDMPGSDMPGSYFFVCAFELGRFVADQDAAEFVVCEWDEYRLSLGVDGDDAADGLPLKRVLAAAKMRAECLPPTEIKFTKVKLPYGWMGNMSAHPIRIDGKRWRTAEALFQAMRFEDVEVREAIRGQNSPMSAKFKAKGQKDLMVVVPCSKKDVANMRQVLRLKVQQNDHVRRSLLCTGNAAIIEDCTNRQGGNGLFWGAAFVDGAWVGENVLGKLWMELRFELRNADSASIERMAA